MLTPYLLCCALALYLLAQGWVNQVAFARCEGARLAGGLNYFNFAAAGLLLLVCAAQLVRLAV